MTADRDLAFGSVRDLPALLHGGEVTPAELAQIFLTRIDRLNAVSRAFITVTGEQAPAEAEALDKAAIAASRLAGIPFASKDLFDVEGVRTTAGSRVLHDRIATEDASAVARLRAAGAVSLGKTNLHEFAYGATGENEVYGTCVNAYDTTRLAGGSSSGSAAAVAFGLVPAALGTDTGGSVRMPAALNGLVGLKPTLGRVSTRGVFPYCWTLDHVGLITRTVADCAGMLAVLAGPDPRDPASAAVPVGDYAGEIGQSVAGLTIGIPANFFFDRADPEILAVTERVADHLARQGAKLRPVTFPDMAHSRAVSLTVQMPEALSAHSALLEERGDLYSASFRAGLAVGQSLLAEHYVRAKRFIEHYRRATDALFEDVDLILTPASPEIAPKLGAVELTRDGVTEPVGNALTRYTTFFNMTGHPAIAVPCGMHSAGLPLSFQLIGGYFREDLLFRAAAAVENHDAFRNPLPPVE